MISSGQNVSSTSAYQYALDYRALGWRIIPALGNKKGAVGWKDYQTRAPDPQELADWFCRRGYFPAVITGPPSNGLVCRDFDDTDSYNAWTVGQSVAKLLPTAETKRGFHVYFRSNWTGYKTLGDSGELRGDGGHYVLLPPAPHKSWIVPPTKKRLLFIESDDLQKYGFLSETIPLSQATTPLTSMGSPVLSCVTPCVIGWEDLSGEESRKLRCAIEETAATGVGQRNTLLFRFARRLKAIPALEDKEGRQLHCFLLEWHKRSRDYIRTRDFETTWIDFRRIWQATKYPAYEDFLREIYERAKANPYTGYAEETNTLAAMCRELQAAHGSEPFYLGLRSVAAMFGKSSLMWGSRRLWLLEQDGLIRCVEKGTLVTGMASTFLWLGGRS